MNTEVFDLGKIGITLGGEYNNKVIYEKLTIVLYKGKSYISTKTIQGLSPEQDIRSWQLVAEAKDAYHMLVDAGKTTLTEKEFLEQLVDATKGRYIVQGNIINAADEEDLTVEHSDLLGIDTLKLANRDNTNGMGYVILRKNKSFAEQVTKENTIYEIRYDFDLNGAEITIPENCVLKFNGGSFKNGIINGNTTKIDAGVVRIFKDITTTGTFKQDKIYVEWFGEIDEDNCHLTIQRAINSNISPNICLINNYKVKAPILIEKSCYLFGSASNINTLSKISTAEDFNGESVIIDRGTSEFKDLAFYTRKDIDTIHAYNSAQFNHCEFYRGKVAIKYVGEGTVNVKINNCRFAYQTNNGIEFSSNTTFNTTNIISNNYFNSCGSPDGNFNPTAEPSEIGKGNGIYSATTQFNLRIINNTFEYCYGFGIQLDANITGNQDILIIGNYFEGNRNGSFYLDILNSEQDLIYSNFTSYPYEKSRNSYVYSHNTPYIIQYHHDVNSRIDISKSIIKSLEDRTLSDRIYLNLNSWENIQDILFDPSFYKIIDTKHVVTTINDTPKLRLYLKKPIFIKIKFTYKVVSGAFGLYQVYEKDKYSSYIVGLYGFINTLLTDNQWHTTEFTIPCFTKNVSIYYKYTGFKLFQNSPGECYISEFEAELVEMPNLSTLEELSPLMNGVKAFYNNILYFYNNVWIPIGSYKGNTNKRPILTADCAGFQYYDTTLKKYIVWNGTEWTNMDGTALE